MLERANFRLFIAKINGETAKRERFLNKALLSLEAQRKDLLQKNLPRRLNYILRKIAECKEEICGLQGRKYTEKKLERELFLLLKLKGVRNAEIADAKICISLDEILVPFEGDEYILPPARMSIDILKREVRITPDEDLLYVIHPHVRLDGRPCWGDIQTYMQELIVFNEFSTLVSMTLAFLRQVNKDDWGIPIIYWKKRGKIK